MTARTLAFCPKCSDWHVLSQTRTTTATATASPTLLLLLGLLLLLLVLLVLLVLLILLVLLVRLLLKMMSGLGSLKSSRCLRRGSQVHQSHLLLWQHGSKARPEQTGGLAGLSLWVPVLGRFACPGHGHVVAGDIPLDAQAVEIIHGPRAHDQYHMIHVEAVRLAAVLLYRFISADVLPLS